MRKFTDNQRFEILESLNLRVERVSVDPECATEFETVENLSCLKKKIEARENNLSIDERAWIFEEIEWKLEMMKAEIEDIEGKSRLKTEISSLNSLINKIT